MWGRKEWDKGMFPQAVHFGSADNFRKQSSHKQSAKRARNSAKIVGFTGTFAHQHPASCLHRKLAPHREHFFSTFVLAPCPRFRALGVTLESGHPDRVDLWPLHVERVNLFDARGRYARRTGTHHDAPDAAKAMPTRRRRRPISRPSGSGIQQNYRRP